MTSFTKKSAMSLNACTKPVRSNSSASCRTTGTLASIAANTIDFWNRLSQQMSYIDGSTHSSSLVDGKKRRSSGVDCSPRPPTTVQRNSSGSDKCRGSECSSVIGEEYRSSSLLDGDERDGHLNTSVVSCFSNQLPSIETSNNEDRVSKRDDSLGQNRKEASTPASWTYCGRSNSSAITNFLDQSPPDSPPVSRGRSVSCNQNQVTPNELSHYDDLTRSSYPDHRLYHQCAINLSDGSSRVPNWHSSFLKSKDCRRNLFRNESKQGNIYNNFLNDDYDDDDDDEKEDLEMELLQPLAGHPEKTGQIVGPGHWDTPMPNSTSVGMDTPSEERTRLHRKYYKHASITARSDRRCPINPGSHHVNYSLAKKRASSWEESETLQRRRSLMLAASLEQCPPGSTGIPMGMIIMPTSSQLELIDKRDLKYYFQHPYPRLFVTYFVIFCNFLLFAEDPISHSHKESDIPMIGNVFSFVVTKYPPEWRWSVIKVLMWILAMLCGMIAGKLLIHGYLFGRLMRLKMFRDDQGSWMTMFLTVIVSLYVFSHAYNLLLLFWYHDILYQITSQMGVSNASVMKAAATGTWLGDLITALMVTDMMLQDNLYPHWATWFRRIWRKSNIPRILIFWVGSVLATSIVVTLIVSDWISWDKLNKDFISTNEISRAFLASSILVMDLLIVMQDWDFPNFTTTLHVNLPGMNVASLKWKYAEVDITGKWFNYGIIFLVMLLDLNMWKNQIFYNPKDYGQYTGPDDKVRTVNEVDIMRDLNISVWTWETRSQFNLTTGKPYYEDDSLMNSRYMGYPLSAKWTAFIPSIIGLVMFVTLVTLYGRFPSNQSHPRDRPVEQCRDFDGAQPEPS